MAHAFQFGPGPDIESARAWIYTVGVRGQERELKMSEVPIECPGLVGPDEMKEWDVVIRLADDTVSVFGGKIYPVLKAPSGRPCIRLLDFPDARPAAKPLLKRRAPYKKNVFTTDIVCHHHGQVGPESEVGLIISIKIIRHHEVRMIFGASWPDRASG